LEDDSEPPAAADLQVWLPPEGQVLRNLAWTFRGKTRPGNSVTMNGQKLLVDGEGRFFGKVVLPAGKSVLKVEAKDNKGNVARVERNVEVAERQFFLLAIADTSVSHVSANLEDMERQGNTGWENGSFQAGTMQVLGRGALYWKGRISGKAFGLTDLRMTAHLDTARDGRLQDFATNLLDPTRFYPVYGDGSDQVQDAQARGKLYILVEAKEGKAQLGNFRAQVQGLELLRYDRALYGGQVQLTKAYGTAATEAKVFAAAQDKAIARRSDIARGTGGSLYYLSARDVIEGSERIELVVRDRLSGLELARVPQARNVDYFIDYREGRVTFKSPVQSAVDATSAMQPLGVVGQQIAWNGQPVFVESVYESRGAFGSGDAAFGAQVKQKLLRGKVQFGAAYVQEGRGEQGPTYRAVGGDLTVQPSKHGKISAEYSYSESRDTLLSVSDDGGLTYGTPRYAQSRYASSSSQAGQVVSGSAVAVRGQLDLAGVLGEQAASAADLPADVSPDSDAAKAWLAKASKDRGSIKGWWQFVQAGYQSGGAVAQQSQQKIGFESSIPLGQRNRLIARYDGNLTSTPQSLYGGNGLAGLWGQNSANNGQPATSGSFSAWNRHTVLLQDSHRLRRGWTVQGNGQYAWGEANNGSTSQSVAAGAGALWQASRRWTLRADQTVIAMGDPAQIRDIADRFITSIGADYKLNQHLSITAAQRLGWGGQNSTQAGVRAQIAPGSTMYVQQRLEDTWQTGRMVSATVVGAESRLGEDKSSRAWGEYQVDALNSGAMNRAVMGVGKRFFVAKGVTLDAGYERQQVFSGPSGAMSRDALSLGGEWLRSQRLKLSTRQEVRLDEGTAAVGGTRKVQVLSLNNAQVLVNRALTLFGRTNYTKTWDQRSDRTEAEALEATVAAAYRPIDHQWLQLLAKATRLVEQRPTNLNAGAQMRSDKWIVSLEPVTELPWQLQFAQKVAWQRATEAMTDLAATSVTSDKWLLVSRLGWHTLRFLDLVAEYRLLATPAANELVHGALLETAWTFAKTIRVGIGYNFSKVEQTPVGDVSVRRDAGGFFVRLIGMY
jgi:hypothetical protein